MHVAQTDTQVCVSQHKESERVSLSAMLCSMRLFRKVFVTALCWNYFDFGRVNVTSHKQHLSGAHCNFTCHAAAPRASVLWALCSFPHFDVVWMSFNWNGSSLLVSLIPLSSRHCLLLSPLLSFILSAVFILFPFTHSLVLRFWSYFLYFPQGKKTGWLRFPAPLACVFCRKEQTVLPLSLSQSDSA